MVVSGGWPVGWGSWSVRLDSPCQGEKPRNLGRQMALVCARKNPVFKANEVEVRQWKLGKVNGLTA